MKIENYEIENFMRHVPVLLKEVIDGLALKPGMTVVDCTLGDGGHSAEILKAIGKKGTLVGFDADPESLLRAKQFLKEYEEQTILVRENFVELKKVLDKNKIQSIDAILMDLGWSSPQFEERGRGFSYMLDEPLDMRYAIKSQDPNNKYQINSKNENSNGDVTAADLVNTLSDRELAAIFRQFGEDRFSKEIAEAIVMARRSKPIERTTELTNLLLDVYRLKLKTTKDIPWVAGHHPATQVYQALRIAVNREFEVLRQALPQAISVLKPGGRLGVITFHSGEDRIVKQFFKAQENKNLTLGNKKPIVAGKEELKLNSRSKSAKLRIIIKI